VEQLASEVNGIVSVYESWPPDILFRYIMERQREVTRLLGLKAPPLLRSRLFAIAGRLAALNGNARFNCGDYSGAHQACQEAYQFAELVDDNELRSWTRINQCMFEIFYDRPRSALQFAMDGQVYAGRTGLGSYLANYEARAHATLGDKNKALLAVGRSYSIMDDLSTEDQGDPGFSITTHNRADLDCETSDVFLRLGDAPKAIEYASSARSVYDKTGLPSLRSQVRISEACGLIAAGEIDTARAQMAESVDLFLARPIDALLIWLDSIFRSLNAAQLKIMENERDRVYEFRSRRKSSNAFISGQVAEEALRDRQQR